MLTEKEYERIHELLVSAERPLFFFHDDPDGLASFLMCYHVSGGMGIPVKAFPQITTMFLKKVEEYQPDVVFVLDVALVDQEFIDGCTVPVIWIDHHELQQRERVTYFNPRKKGNDNIPTPALIYGATHSDLWLATTGCIGDWHVPSFVNEFREQYPGLLPEGALTPGQALFDSPLSTLVQVFSFNLKGPTSEVKQAVKVFARIESPNEILKQETPRGKFLYKKYLQIKKAYDDLLNDAIQSVTKSKILVHTYPDDKLSLTKDIANELLYRHPEKIIVFGRKKDGEYRCSIRSSEKYHLPQLLEKAMKNVTGHFGGHEQACGAGIQEQDFALFLKQLEEAVT